MSSSTAPAVIRLDYSTVFMPENGPRRLPRAPNRKRPEKFWQAFESKALFYDCFWHIDGRRVLLAGPPPLNLEKHFQAARFIALPSGAPLKANYFAARSTMLTELMDVPEGTSSVNLELAGLSLDIPVRENCSTVFAGRNLITTMNKNNELNWICRWLDWHVRLHGADAVLMFDNGSDAYSTAQLEEALASVAGIKTVCVASWPYSYGPYDPGVIFHRHWANFLQMASLQVLHRRFGATANAILNCDIDELVGRDNDGPDVFSKAKNSPLGLVTLRGQWVETTVADDDKQMADHLRYRYRDKSKLRSICANKWCLDPSREWLEPLNIKPSVHRIYGIHKSKGRSAPSQAFYHFKAINTNWKVNRRQNETAPTDRQVRLEQLDASVAQYLHTQTGA